jgi:hypothetical protein
MFSFFIPSIYIFTDRELFRQKEFRIIYRIFGYYDIFDVKFTFENRRLYRKLNYKFKDVEDENTFETIVEAINRNVNRDQKLSNLRNNH